MHISYDYPFSNRAAVYGDGCFTTIAVEQGKVELLNRHIQRLQRGCARLNIELTQIDWCNLETAVVASAEKQQSGIVKVLLSAGSASRGYLRGSECQPCCYIQTLPSVEHYIEWRKAGIALGISTVKLALQQSLAGIKHLNRLEQVLVKEHTSAVSDSAFQDVIVLDEQDMLVEVSAGNLFWCAHGRWFTPDLYYSGVEGVMRNYVIECFRLNNIAVNQIRCRAAALNSASDVFICNSLMKMVPVNDIWLTPKRRLSFNNCKVPELAEIVNKAIKMESM